MDVDLDDRISAPARSQLRCLIHAYRPNEVGPGLLHEVQVVGVIDDAVRIRVLEIDAEREMVLAAKETAAVGGVEFPGHLRAISPTSRMRSPWTSSMSDRCMPQPGRNIPSTATSPPTRSVRLSLGSALV